MICPDCHHEIRDADAVHTATSERVGCYYQGEGIFPRCALDRYYTALRALRDELWRDGNISAAGLVRMDRVLGIDTYEPHRLTEGNHGRE